MARLPVTLQREGSPSRARAQQRGAPGSTQKRNTRSTMIQPIEDPSLTKIVQDGITS